MKTYPGTYFERLTAFSEGFCPEHRVPLMPDCWCRHCGPDGAWWSLEYDPDGGPCTIVTRYPFPGEETPA